MTDRRDTLATLWQEHGWILGALLITSLTIALGVWGYYDQTGADDIQKVIRR